MEPNPDKEWQGGIVRKSSLPLALLWFGLLVSAHAQTNYQRIKSFGFPEFAGGGPSSALIEGSDGYLYGTDSATAFRLMRDGGGYTVLHRWSNPGRGLNGVVEGNDGALYGTQWNGSGEAGTVFKLNKDGSGFAVLRSFSKSSGRWPTGSLVVGSNGALYGTTSGGGARDLGTVFKINPDGSGYTLLNSFQGAQDAADPTGALLKGSDGTLYGTADYGGTNAFGGGVFKLNQDGTGYAVLHSFTDAENDASGARGLIQGTDGALYGTTYSGGLNYNGTVFKLNVDGTGYTVLRRFTGTSGDGSSPNGLSEANDGTLCGTTSQGGLNQAGTVFKLNKDGSSYSVLRSFTGLIQNQDGSSPLARLLQGRDGTLYGTTVSGGLSEFSGPLGDGTVFKINQDGSGYSVLLRFNTSGGDGSGSKGLTQGSDGNLYGTTPSGGAHGAGTVFKLNRDGAGYAILHDFTGPDGDGSGPGAGLAEGTDGALYGATGAVGLFVLVGTVFKLNKDGTGFTVLRSFTGLNADGYDPQGLVTGTDGALYGTAAGGGIGSAGTVFKLNQDGGSFIVLHDFTGNGGDGSSPQAGLIEGSDGALYGTTSEGGLINAGNPFGAGTVFKLKRDGTGYTGLLRFTGTSGDGKNPQAGLVQGDDGALYGTTEAGGITNEFTNPDGFGTVFKLNRDGTGYTVLHQFTGSNGDGSNPTAGLAKGGPGVLYGTTSAGGSHSAGTVFKLNQDGSGYTVLRSFGGSAADGNTPNALTITTDGTVYGTTALGGDMGLGTLFKLFWFPPQIAFTSIQPDGAAVRLTLAGGAAGQLCRIQVTTSLSSPSWQTIGTNTTDIDGTFQFLDTAASNDPIRFYRTAAP